MTQAIGRPKGPALTRLVELLTLLAEAGPDGVTQGAITAKVKFGANTDDDARTMLRRDIRKLKKLGWVFRKTGLGKSGRYQLVGQDPRVAILLNSEELAEVARAVSNAGKDPADFGVGVPLFGATKEAKDDRASAHFSLEELMHAHKYQCLVEATYRGQPRTLHIDTVRRKPGGAWLVAARESHNATQKQFIIDRFEGAITIREPGSASSPQPDMTDMNPLGIVQGVAVDAVVETTAEFETRVVRELGQPRLRQSDGDTIRLTVPVHNRWLWQQRLYQLGTRVRLIGPEGLRADIRQDLLQYTRLENTA